MAKRLLYVELKDGYSGDGPAWIGQGSFSKAGVTIYFDGKIFKRCKGISGNHFDLETGLEYWISGVKQKGTNRHWAGGGVVAIDESVVPEFLELTGLSSLPPSGFRLVRLDNSPAKELGLELENRKARDAFDHTLRFKPLNELTDAELIAVVGFYERQDMPSIHKKARKNWIESKNLLLAERERRGIAPSE